MDKEESRAKDKARFLFQAARKMEFIPEELEEIIAGRYGKNVPSYCVL